MKKQNHLARLLGWTVALAGVLSMGHMARATIVYNNSTSPESPSVLLQNGYEFGDEVNLVGGVGTYLTNFTFQYYGSNLSASAWIQLRIYADNGQAYSLTNFNRTNFDAPGDMLYDSGTNNLIDAHNGATLSFINDALHGNLAIHVPANFTWTVTFGDLGAGASAGLYLYSPPTVGSGYDDFWELSGANSTWVYRATDSTNLDLSFAAIAQGAVVVDTVAPKLAIKIPATHAKLYSGSFGTNITVSGTATEKNSQASLVLFRNGTNSNFVVASLNGGAGTWSTPNGFVSIGADNFVQAKAVNKAGLESSLETAQYTLIVTNKLTLTVNAPAGTSGSAIAGTPSTVVPNASLIIGKAYKVTATPGANCLFSNWTASVAGGPFAAVSTSAKYSFVMTTNLSLTANFSTNLFTALAGSYNGLFSDNSNLMFTNSGYFSVKITSKPLKQATFSVKFVSAGKSYGGAGTFGLNGVGLLKKPIARKNGLASLTASLTVPLDGSSNITGVVSDGNWTASLSGAPIYAGTAYDNTYTMVLPSSGANIGNGWGTLTIIDGVTKLTGKLADGQKFAQTTKVNLHADGTWPMYVGEDKLSGIYSSSLIGTLKVTTNFTLTATNLTWIKTGNNVPASPAAGSFYAGANAFTNVVGLNCSAFTNLAPVIPLHALGLIPNHGVITLNNGGVTGGTITNGVTLTTPNGKNKFTADPINVNKLTLTVSPKTGALTVGLKEGGSTPKGKGGGVVLQNQNDGLGYFFLDGTTKSGSFSVQ